MADRAEKTRLHAILAGRFGCVRHLAVTGSTNKDLLASPFASQAAAPTLLWADHQSAGRGRRDRVWHDEPGRSLTFSVAFERGVRATDSPPGAFSLVAGLVVVRALIAQFAGASHHLRLKWPNDILIDDRKVVGILCEVRRERALERLVIGCGINLHPPALSQTARESHPLVPGGLLESGQQLTDQASEKLVAAIALGLADAVPTFYRDGFAVFHRDWEALDVFANRPVQLVDDGRQIGSGICRGVDEDGALLIEQDQTGQNGSVRAYAVGDVSARSAGSVR